MRNNGTQLPKITLANSAGGVSSNASYTLEFNYKHGITGLALDQQPVYGAEAEMADGTLVQHFRGYRSEMSIQFTDRYLVDTTNDPDTVNHLTKEYLGVFCKYLRGWKETGGEIRLYPYRDSGLYMACIIPAGGFTWTPGTNDGQPKTKVTDYSLTLVAKALTQTQWIIT